MECIDSGWLYTTAIAGFIIGHIVSEALTYFVERGRRW